MNFLDRHFGRLGNRMFQNAYIYAQFKDGKIPDIYLQNPKYFDKYRDEIKRLFGEGIGYDERVAIHVRRGDYVGNPFYVDLSKTDYYGSAMNDFGGEQLLCFSDDIKWCKDYFKFVKRMDFSEDRIEEEDLKLMASCKGIIMSNSSFAWWAAYLGNENKKVICPKMWFLDGIQRVGFLKEWIAI